MNFRHVACALLSLSLGTIVWAAEQREEAATGVASSWLTLIDQAKYADAWEILAEDMQADLETKEQYERTMASMAKKVGKVNARRVTSATDDGTRVIVKFAVATNKPGTTTETVTLVQEPDGNWRVTGHVLDMRASGVTSRR